MPVGRGRIDGRAQPRRGRTCIHVDLNIVQCLGNFGRDLESMRSAGREGHHRGFDVWVAGDKLQRIRQTDWGFGIADDLRVGQRPVVNPHFVDIAFEIPA